MDKEDQTKVFEAFNRYPWESDNVFQSGLQSILSKMPTEENDGETDKELLEEAKLMKAKHFYFSR